ncbi:MAG: hypothetical protein ACREP9_02845, partial [Candidatus Dormibacteraceae bacterium]
MPRPRRDNEARIVDFLSYVHPHWVSRSAIQNRAFQNNATAGELDLAFQRLADEGKLESRAVPIRGLGRPSREYRLAG